MELLSRVLLFSSATCHFPASLPQAMRTFLTQQNLPTKPLWQHLLCAKEQRVSLCPLYKAASTFLVKKMLLLAPSGKYDR